jgi:hypothetical protein
MTIGRGRSRATRASAVALLALAGAAAAGAADKHVHPAVDKATRPHERDAQVFGVRTAITGDEVCRIRGLLAQLRDQPACARETGKACPAGIDLLTLLFGELYNSDFPDLVVYIDEHGRSSSPRLLWRGENTAHLYGARRVWVLVFSDLPRTPEGPYLSLRHTVDQWATSLPSVGILSLGVPELKEPEGPTSKHTDVDVKFVPIGDTPAAGQAAGACQGPPNGPRQMWYATLSVPVTADTSNRISIYPKPPGAADDKDKEKEKKDKEPPAAPASPPAPDQFLVIRGHFSNSRAGRIGVSVALAWTARTTDTRLEGSAVGSYLFSKVYIRKPEMHVREIAHGQGPFRPSIAVGLGTRISSAFREGIVMVSIGHVTDKFGLFAGLNLIGRGTEERPVVGTADKQNVAFDRAKKFIFGVDYTF